MSWNHVYVIRVWWNEGQLIFGVLNSLNLTFLESVDFDDYANDVDLDDGVFMSLFMSMDYNMTNMLLVVDVLNLYMLNVDVCGDCMYNIDDDYWRRFVWTYALLLSHMFMHHLLSWIFISILSTTNTLYSIIDGDYCRRLSCFCCIMRWRPWWLLVSHAYRSCV